MVHLGPTNSTIETKKEEARWHSALVSLQARCQRGEMPEAQYHKIVEVLGAVNEAKPCVRKPLLSPASGCYRIVWSYKDVGHVLEVDIDEKGQVEWFLLNRRSGESEVSPCPSRDVQDRMIQLVSTLF